MGERRLIFSAEGISQLFLYRDSLQRGYRKTLLDVGAGHRQDGGVVAQAFQFPWKRCCKSIDLENQYGLLYRLQIS